MKPTSKLLSSTQIKGLTKVGDAYFPGDGELPSFSQCGCVEHADAAIELLPPDDLASLKTLLGAIGIMPGFVATSLVRLAERGPRMNGPLGVGLRFLRLGLKGVVTSLYYSGEVGHSYKGPSPLEVLGYHVKVYTADVDERDAKSTHGPGGSIAACRGLK
jgi:hypothetical protein